MTAVHLVGLLLRHKPPIKGAPPSWMTLPDDVEARRLYRLAAQQGHAKALFRLGDMNFDGRVDLRDDMKAFQWFHLAAEQGHLKGQQFRAIVENRMSPTDISEARKLASICLQSGYEDCGG